MRGCNGDCNSVGHHHSPPGPETRTARAGLDEANGKRRPQEFEAAQSRPDSSIGEFGPQQVIPILTDIRGLRNCPVDLPGQVRGGRRFPLVQKFPRPDGKARSFRSSGRGWRRAVGLSEAIRPIALAPSERSDRPVNPAIEPPSGWSYYIYVRCLILDICTQSLDRLFDRPAPG
jgi:hypothetical protein